MHAERFHRLLTSQLRELKDTLEVEHDREVSRLLHQVARLQNEITQLRAGSQEEVVFPAAPPAVEILPPLVSPMPLLRDSQSSQRQIAWNDPGAVVVSAGVPPVEMTSVQTEAVSEDRLIKVQFPEDTVSEASEAMSSEPVATIAVNQSSLDDETELTRLSSLRSQRHTKRSSTAPGTLSGLPTLLASRRLAVPLRSATELLSEPSGAAELPGSCEGDRSAKTSRRPSNASYISFRATFADGRPSVMTDSSTESGGAAFKVLDVWAESQWRKSRRIVCSLMAPDVENLEDVDSSDQEESGEHYNVKGLLIRPASLGDRFRWLRRCMIQPGSKKHLLWESIGLMLIMYDIVVVPLDIFDLPDLALMISVSWFIRLFWTADIICSFFTGFLDSQGHVVLDPAQVARRYARTWFSLDLTCISFDWATALSESAGVLRGARLLRAVKLLRFAKAQVIKDSIAEHILSEQLRLIAKIAKSITMLLTVAHVIACLWYWMGLHGHDLKCSSAGWVIAKRLNRAPLWERYAWSFHWSLALVAGETHWPPENKCERTFTIAALFVNFLHSCLFVSSITTSMTQLEIIASKQASQMSALRRYLSAHSISTSLAVRVQRNAQHAIAEQRRSAPEDSVELLTFVSEPLRAELHFEVHAPVLMAHPFFDLYHSVNPMGVQKLCHTAVTHLTLSRGDVVFSDLETPALPRMFFVTSGRLLYSKQSPGDPTPSKPTIVKKATQTSDGSSSVGALGNVGCGQWASEASLWTRWIHHGTLKSVSECTLLALDADKFQRVISPFPTHHAHLYASAFVDHLNVLDSSSLTDLRIVDQEGLIEYAFPEMMIEDAASGSWRISHTMRLSNRIRAQRTKSSIWK